MKILAALALTVVAVLVAIAVERLIAHFCRRADDDSTRLDAAVEAMHDQQESLDALMARDTVPEIVKAYLAIFSEAALSKSAAHAMFRAVEGKSQAPLSREVEIKIKAFQAGVDLMRERDAEAYELYRTYIYRVPIMSFLQRPETYKAMGQLSLRLAEEREPAAARDAALMTEAALPAAA